MPPRGNEGQWGGRNAPGRRQVLPQTAETVEGNDPRLLGAVSSIQFSRQLPRFTGVRMTVTMKASPSPQRVYDVLCLASRVRCGTQLTFDLLLKLLRKLTAALAFVPLGPVDPNLQRFAGRKVRGLVATLTGQGLDPMTYQGSMVRVSSQCLRCLQEQGLPLQWRAPWFCPFPPGGSASGRLPLGLVCRVELPITEGHRSTHSNATSTLLCWSWGQCAWTSCTSPSA